MAKKPEGRPSKLTPERHEQIIQSLRTGNYREITATYAGIHVATLYRWLEEGEADAENGKETPHRELYEAATRAEAEAEVAAVAAIRLGFMGRPATERQLDDGTVVRTAAIDPDWRAAAEYLQRRHPKRWSKTDRLDVEVDQSVQHNVTVELVPEEDRREEVARILERALGDGDG